MAKVNYIEEFISAIKQDPSETNNKYSAVVSRVDNEGTVWVQIAGSEKETPTVRSSAEVKPGDNVNVEWRNNKLYIAGNVSNPSAGGAAVRQVANDVSVLNTVVTDNITANNARFVSLESDTAKIHSLTADELTASVGYVSDLTAGNVSASDIVADHATIGSLDSNYAHITNGTIDNAKIGYADVNDLNAHYAGIDLANVNNAWIQNGVIKNGAIADAQIIGVSANKLTAGTIDASNITVTNLNASNITTGSITVDGITIDVENNESSIDGAYIEDGTITMNGFAQEVKDVIDGAIETFTGTVVPTLNNAPANAWTTTKLKDQHIGDVYYVVNSSSEQNGYCYRFTKSGSTYSWQLIKDSDVTAALSRLTTAEGKIGNIETFDEQMATFKTETEGEISTLQTKTTSLETSLGDKVDTSTFNTLSQTVDGNSASITTLTTTTQTLRNDLDGLEIGGRNLILDTATQRVSPASASGSAYVSPIPTLSAYGQSIFTNTDDYWTYSFDYEVTGNSSTKSDIYFQAKGTMASGSSLVVSGNESGHYSKTFKLDSTQASATNTACRIRLRNATDGAVLTVNKIKLEKGNKETDWSPAPEDMEETVTTISNTVNTVSQTATTNSSHISQLTTTLGTNADGTTKAGDVMHQVSQLDQDLDGITTRVGKTEVQILGQYATSTTAKGTAAKVATITPSVTGWALYTGATITVKFTNENTTTTPTLNVNSTGSKTIKGFKGAALTEAEYKWAANDAVTFIYNGTYWLMQNSSTQATRLSTAETSVTQTATSIESLASNTATYTKPDGTTGTNSMASAITQNAEGITLEAKKRESATNILLDADAPTTAKIYAPSSRYWSNSNKTWCTPSIVEISDPPIAGINYACRFVATDTGHTTDDYGRAIAFYGGENTTDLPLKVGTKYTVSCWARCISGQGKLQISYRHKQTASRNAIAPTDLTPDWKYYTGTVELESMPTDYTRIWFYPYFLANTAGTIEICGMKLVAGDNVEAYSTKIEQMANNVLIQATANDTTAADGGQHLIQSLINVAPEGVTIDADKVNIAGATIFTSGRLSESNLNNAYDANGAATSALNDAKSYVDGKGYQTASDVSTAVGGKADKTDAIARTQRIYYRKTSSGAPSKNTTWLSTSGTGYGNWSLKIPQMTSGTTKYPYLYTAVQTQTVSQQAAGSTCTCSDVLLDDTTTVIDGGNIITGTVSANAVNASSGTFDTANIPNLNASKILISDYNNYITASELNSATLAGPNCEIADGWIHKTGTDSNVWISPILDQWATEGEQYRITGIAKTTNAGRVRVAIYGRTGSTAEGFMYTPWISTEADTPTLIDEVLTITEDIASKPGINIAILFQENQNGTYASSEGYCKKMKCERMSGGSLIVDGSITADKIAANAVTANKIAANSITADKLAIGSVPSGGVNLLLETSVARTATISLNSSNYYAYDFYPLVRPLPKLFKEGELVTISFDWSTTATGGNFHLECGVSIPYIWGTVKNASGTRSATSNYIDITSSNTSGHAEITFAITNAVATAADTLRYFRIRIDGTETASKTITISNAKVERGGSASAWTPAPEDADIEYIIGTQTDTTGTWTGASSKTLYLYDGLRIRYYLPYAGSGNATLNLTNVKGNALGAKSVYRYGTTTLTTHYPTGSIVPLRYNGSAWMVDGATNTDTYDRTRFNNAITANTAITAGRIICGTVNGYKNIGAGISFDTTCPLLYASSAIAATKTGTNNYLTMPSVVATNNGTITSAAAKKVLYLKGTLSGSTFTISASPFMTTAPTTDEGICYIPLGVMYDTTHIYFTSSQDIYSYQNGTLQKVDSVSKYVTRITDSGIRIHSSSTKNNSVVINDSGMEVFKGGTGATNSIAKFGTNSSSNTETFTKILYEVTALGDDVTVPELATADSGSTITVTTRRRNFESGGVSILVLTFTKGTSGTSYAIQYDGNSTFSNGNTDWEFTFLKVEYTATATPKIIRLGNTTTNKSGILFGNSNSNGNLDSFSVSLNGDINTLGSLYSANVGFTNVMGATGSISKDVSTTSGTWTPLMNFSLIEGVYMAIADISFNANANGCRMANISATSAQNWQYVTQGATPGSSAKTSLTVPIILHPTETTTYYVNAYQNSGGSLNATVELYYVRIR